MLGSESAQLDSGSRESTYHETESDEHVRWTTCPKLLWQEMVALVSTRETADLEKSLKRSSPSRSRAFASRSAPRLVRLIVAIAIGGTLAIVIFHMLLLGVNAFREAPDPFDEIFLSQHASMPLSRKPQEDYDMQRDALLQSAIPVRCHSHNDYRRRVPLYAALGSGCISVETDIWLFDDDLYVGHDMESLKRDATLSSLYLRPLEKILLSRNNVTLFGTSEAAVEARHGIFSVDPVQSLVVLIDFKNAGAATYAHLDSQLSGLREGGWLTHWDGTKRVERQITVVVSGRAPFDLIASNSTYRDIFFDAPLDHLVDADDPALVPPANQSRKSSESTEHIHGTLMDYKYNPSNSYYASTDFTTVVGHLPNYRISPSQMDILTSYMRHAELRGLVPRYWGTPSWPRSFRDHIWQLLLEENVGVLNVDDLRAMRKGHWGDFSNENTYR